MRLNLRSEWGPRLAALALLGGLAIAYRGPIGSGLAAARAAATGREGPMIPAPGPPVLLGPAAPPGWTPGANRPAGSAQEA